MNRSVESTQGWGGGDGDGDGDGDGGSVLGIDVGVRAGDRVLTGFDVGAGAGARVGGKVLTGLDVGVIILPQVPHVLGQIVGTSKSLHRLYLSLAETHSQLRLIGTPFFIVVNLSVESAQG